MSNPKYPNHQKFLSCTCAVWSVGKTHQNKQKVNARKKLRVPSQKIQLAALGIKQYQRLNYQQKVDAINHRSERSQPIFEGNCIGQ